MVAAVWNMLGQWWIKSMRRSEVSRSSAVAPSVVGCFSSGMRVLSVGCSQTSVARRRAGVRRRGTRLSQQLRTKPTLGRQIGAGGHFLSGVLQLALAVVLL